MEEITDLVYSVNDRVARGKSDIPDVAGSARAVPPSGSKGPREPSSSPREPSLAPSEEDKTARGRSRPRPKNGEDYPRGDREDKSPSI